MGRKRGLGERQRLGGAPGIEHVPRILTGGALGYDMFAAKRFFTNGNGPT
jgi:hypothetical protein